MRQDTPPINRIVSNGRNFGQSKKLLHTTEQAFPATNYSNSPSSPRYSDSDEDEVPPQKYASNSWMAENLVDDSGLASALVQLRAIVGDDATDEVLKDLLLAADLDVNRAINYYFGTHES